MCDESADITVTSIAAAEFRNPGPSVLRRLQRRVGTPSGGIAETTINTTMAVSATNRAAAASSSNAVGRIRGEGYERKPTARTGEGRSLKGRGRREGEDLWQSEHDQDDHDPDEYQRA